MSLGVHFALDSATEGKFLALADAGDDDALLGLLEQVEETWPDPQTCHHDTAWDALHRTLTDGKLEYTGGEYPLAAAVLGGRQLITGEQAYTISYVSADQVREIAAALDDVDEEWFRRRYFALVDTDYYGPVDEDDFDFTWADFEDTREFFARQAEAGTSVIFTVDA